MKFLHVLCLVLILSTVAGYPYPIWSRDDGAEGEETVRDDEEGSGEDEGGDGEGEGEEGDDEEGDDEEEEAGDEDEEGSEDEGNEEGGEEGDEEGGDEGEEEEGVEQQEEGSGESERRDSFLSDLQKTVDFENQFNRDGHLSPHESKVADSVREYIEFGKSWEAKKKGLETKKEKQGSEKDGETEEKRLGFMNDLLDTLQFEKQFYKKGMMSPREEKVAKETREFLKFGQAWREKKNHLREYHGGQAPDPATEEEHKLAQQLKNLLHQKDTGSAAEKKAEELFEILE